MAAYSQTALIDEMEKIIAVGGEEFRSDFYEYVTQTVGLSNAQAASILRGGALNKFSGTVLKQLFKFLTPKMSDDMKMMAEAVVPPDEAKLDMLKARKARFISETYNDKPHSSARTVFTHLHTAYECPNNKDICEATADELIHAIADTTTPNCRTITNGFVMIRDYLEWCVKNGIEVPHKKELDALVPGDIDVSLSIAQTLISGPEELDSILSQISHVSVVRDSIPLILVWLGFTVGEIANLKESDVDTEIGSVRNPYFGEIAIPQALIKYFEQYESDLNEDEYMLHTTDFYMKRLKTGRVTDTEPMKATTVRQNISIVGGQIRRIPNLGYNITSRGLFVAGGMWKLRNIEQENGAITADDISRCLRVKIQSYQQKNQWERLYKGFTDTYF